MTKIKSFIALVLCLLLLVSTIAGCSGKDEEFVAETYGSQGDKWYFGFGKRQIVPDETIWEDFDNVMKTGEPLTRNLEVRDMTLRLTIAPTTDELGAIVGIEAEPFEDVVAFVACNGHCGATKNKADYQGVQTCKAAGMLYGGPGTCTYGCLGCGDCAKVCPANAICTIDGIAHVDTSRCLGCGVCVRHCPKGIIYMVPQDTKVVVMCSNKDKGADARKACTNACIGCKKCEKNCPHEAIHVANNLAYIMYSKCTGCGQCVADCPTGCLKNVFFPDLPEGTLAEDLLEQ